MNMKNDKPEEDYLFLDRFANAVSLILLNEKTKFESFERMKGNFLEQILQTQLPANEIIKRGKYASLDLEQPYYVVVMEYRKTEISIYRLKKNFIYKNKFLNRFFNILMKKNNRY